MHRILSITAILLAFIPLNVSASPHRTISSVDGISNNAVLSLHQNSLGHIYLGTADGLNIWDGKQMTVYHAPDGYNYFFGNMIKHFHMFNEDILYIQTNYGLAKISTETGKIDFFHELESYLRILLAEEDLILALDSDHNLQAFDSRTRTISRNTNAFIPTDETVRRMVMLEDGRLCIFTAHDTYIVSMSRLQSGEISFTEIINLNMGCRYVSQEFLKGHDKGHYLITTGERLCFFETESCKVSQITELGHLPGNTVTGIVPAEEGYYISFLTKGLYLLPEGSGDLVPTDIDCGIFTIIPDKMQPIIWVGTDSNGLIRYSRQDTDIVCLTYDKLPHSIKMPVRSIFVDRQRTLWFGTKGEGLYRIRNFDRVKKSKDIKKEDVEKFRSENTPLTDNSVYAITEGASGALWIGTGGKGLNCWSYREGRLREVSGSKSLGMVHSIVEENDSTIWVATDNSGAFRCTFAIRGDVPVITDIKAINYCKPFNEETSFFSASIQNDTTIWFGSRMRGILKYNPKSLRSKVIQFSTDNGLATNEIFFVEKSDKMLFATGNGLVIYSPQTDSCHVSDFIPKKATHGIVCDKDKNIWVSTNSGIISLDSTYNYRLSYNSFSGLEIIEYSDGACHYDRIGDNVIFGGINGLTVINNSGQNAGAAYTPDIHITDFIQNNTVVNIGSVMKKGKLTIPYSKSIFGIKFSVTDHLCYPDYEFRYTIEGYNKDRIITNEDVIYLPAMNPGNYRLKISYKNKATGYESQECMLPIYLKPPFYRSYPAYCLYCILAGFTVFLLLRRYRMKYQQQMENLHRKYSKEVNKVISKTTSAINEDLSVQITFIIGLCQQIRHAASNNPFVADKVNLVEYNIGKINRTLHMYNEYKNISEQLIHSGQTTLIPVCQTVTEILELIKEIQQARNVSINYRFDDNITIILKKEAFLTMIYSLLYKVTAITSGPRNVEITICREGETGMTMTVGFTADRKTYDELMSSAGHRNIPEEDFDFIVCRMLIQMMGWNMETSFDQQTGIITLVLHLNSLHAEAGAVQENTVPSVSENINVYNTLIGNRLPDNFKSSINPDHIYIMSKDKDISTFLAYFLADSYNTHSFGNNISLIERMEKHIPLAVIYDASSMQNRFKEYMEGIAGNKRLEQVTVIVLTSPLQVKEREEYVTLGADLCVSFPFNMDYLISALEKLLQKKKKNAEYHKLPTSTYTIEDGKFIHQDDKEFMHRLFTAIDENLADSRLSAAMIAEILGTSTRVMYRKLEQITDKKLHQIIRETRMRMASTLLSSTRLSVDEIMYKVGYDTRSTFFRNFKEVYGKTPKEYRNEVSQQAIESMTC